MATFASENRCGERTEPESPTTHRRRGDGYWLFVAGLVLGVLSVVVFFASTASGRLRKLAIAFVGLGLVSLLARPAFGSR